MNITEQVKHIVVTDDHKNNKLRANGFSRAWKKLADVCSIVLNSKYRGTIKLIDQDKEIELISYDIVQFDEEFDKQYRGVGEPLIAHSSIVITTSTRRIVVNFLSSNGTFNPGQDYLFKLSESIY